VNVPVLRVKKVRYPEKKACPEKKSKTRQKKMSELDPFFNDEALVKGITKDSKRLRPYGTVCVMPKYTSAIVNELVYCGTKSPLGMCNRKGEFRFFLGFLGEFRILKYYINLHLR